MSLINAIYYDLLDKNVKFNFILEINIFSNNTYTMVNNPTYK